MGSSMAFELNKLLSLIYGGKKPSSRHFSDKQLLEACNHSIQPDLHH